MSRFGALRLSGALLACALACATAWAQTGRDPTEPPAQLRSASTVPGGADGQAMPWGKDGLAVLVRNAKPMLVVGGRLYAAGQSFDRFTVLRLSETEVWLREGGVVHKMPVFQGITRTAVASSIRCPTPATKPTTHSTSKSRPTPRQQTMAQPKPVQCDTTPR